MIVIEDGGIEAALPEVALEVVLRIKVLGIAHVERGVSPKGLYPYSFEMPSLIVYRIRSACLWILSLCIRFRRWTWTVFR